MSIDRGLPLYPIMERSLEFNTTPNNSDPTEVQRFIAQASMNNRPSAVIS